MNKILKLTINICLVGVIIGGWKTNEGKGEGNPIFYVFGNRGRRGWILVGPGPVFPGPTKNESSQNGENGEESGLMGNDS